MAISRFFLFFVVFLLSLMINTAVAAGERTAGRSGQWSRPLATPEFILAAADNPWALPQMQRAQTFPHYYNADKDNPFRSGQMKPPPVYNNGNSSGRNEYNRNKYNRNGYNRYQVQPRYVTPAILQSIRKQQMRTQQISPSWQQRPYRKHDYWQYNSSPDGYGRGSNPGNNPVNSYGNGSANSALPVKPGTLLDESLLDGNGGLPLSPDMTTVEGISPLSTNEPLPPELSGNNYYRSGRYFDPMAFNPASMFGPFDNFSR